MKRDQVKKFLKALGVFNTSDRGGWVNCSCVLAPWTHVSGTDKNPSFGITVNDIGESVYKCWSCGKVGGLGDLVMALQYQVKKHPGHYLFDFQQAYNVLASEEIGIFPYQEQDFEDDENANSLVHFPESWLKSFPTIKNHPYLDGRGVPLELSEKYDLRVDFADRRVCVPIRTWDGILVGLQGRAVYPDPKLPYRYYLYKGESNNHVWLGEWQCNPNGIVIVCEGMFDLFSITQAYENVVGSMTASLSAEKLERLQDCYQIITFYDYGTGGDSAREKITKYYTATGNLNQLLGHCYPTEQEGDPGNMTTNRIKEELSKINPWMFESL